MKYFINYYRAKEYAKKHHLRECDYGDYDDKVSYCVWNKSGNRDKEAEIECYYLFDGRYPDTRVTNDWLLDWCKHKIGLDKADITL